MVQIIPRKESLLEKLTPAFENMGEAFGNHLAGSRRKEAGNKFFGEGFGDLSPELQKIKATEDLRGENQRKKTFQNEMEDKKSYDIVEKRFGKEAADLWKTSTEGGKTKLLQNLLENEQRSQGLNQQLGNQDQQNEIPEEIKKPDFKVIDYDKGTTPKERVTRQNTRYEKALPLIQASQTKLHALDTIGEEIGILQELSPQIGGWERLNIDPKTGDLIIPALASPESQQFAKTINDFTRQAKDSYGSRVTNFDLNQFMRRLPTLANSSEGRNRILAQMNIINNLDKLYEQTLHDVFDEHGGIRNIDYDRAFEIAYKKFLNDSKPLKAEMKELASGDKKEFKSVIEGKKKNAPKGQVLMMTKDGQFGYVPESEVNDAMKDGLIIP